MKKIYSGFYLFLIFTLISFSVISANEKERVTKLKSAVSSKGYIGFTFGTTKNYSNGLDGEDISQTLLELPELGQFIFLRSYSSINIAFLWEKQSTHKGFFYYLKELKGPEKYFIQISWDADAGLSAIYVNGIPLKLEKEIYNKPWEVKGSASEFKLPKGVETLVTNVEVLSEYLNTEDISSKVPAEFKIENVNLFKADVVNSDESLVKNKRKGELLFVSEMNKDCDFENWKMEGPGIVGFLDDQLCLKSEIPNPSNGFTGHFNYWAPMEFPENFIAEWEFKPVSEHGVCHFFFAAKGENGQDIMDTSLAVRDGHYSQYHSGDLKNYFLIYFSNWGVLRATNFATSSLHKSNKYAFLEMGEIAVPPGANKYIKLKVIKNMGHIQLWADGKLCLDYLDKGKNKYGEINKEGRIGFRQMAETVAQYRNFKVWKLK